MQNRFQQLLTWGTLAGLTSMHVNASELRLELDIQWEAPTTANGPIAELQQALSSTEDTWVVSLELGDFLVTSTAGEHFAVENQGLISMQVDSSTPVPENIPPADGHLAIISGDAVVASRFDSEFDKFGRVRVEDNTRGAVNFAPGWNWTFTRGLNHFLPEGIAMNDEEIIAHLNSEGTSLRVEEAFVKSQIANFFRYGNATIVSAEIIGEQNAPATCRHELVNEWPDGFHSAVYIRNTSDKAIDGWDLMIQLTNGLNISHSWGTILTGSSPEYSGANLDWNQKIYPGQEINFGFVGSKSTTGTPIGVAVSAAICQN